MTVTEKVSEKSGICLPMGDVADTRSAERIGPIFSPVKTVYSPMSFCLVGALFGILWDAFLAPGPLFWTLFFLLTALFRGTLRFWFPAVDALWGGEKSGWRFRIPPDVWGTVLVMAATASFFGLRHDVYWNRYPADEIGRLIPASGSPATVECYVDETPEFIPPPETTAGTIFQPTPRTLFAARIKRIKNHAQWEASSGRIQVMVGGDARFLRLGDRIQLSGLAWHPSVAKNPGDIDRAFQCRCKRILIHLTVSLPESVTVLERGAKFPFRRFFERIRLASQRRFNAALKSENAALASAMILGIRSDIDEETTEEFRETGTAHLLAISGLHVALISIFLLFFLRFFHFSRRVTVGLLAGGIFFYLMMTDLRPSAIRAAVMVWILCGALFFRRSGVSVNSFAVSALVILLLNPTDLFQTGVHLSFLATGVFLWFHTPTGNPATNLEGAPSSKKTRLEKWFRQVFWGIWWRFPLLYGVLLAVWRFIQKIFQIFLLTTVINFVLLPIILRQLNIMTPVSLFINPVIWIPLQFSLIFGLILLTVGPGFPVLGGLAAGGANLSFDLFRHLLQVAYDIPGGSFQMTGPAFWWTIGFYLPLLGWTLFPKTRPKKRIALLFIVLWSGVGFSAGLVNHLRTRAADQMEIDILSVGHGGAMLLHYPDRRTVLYDCGSFSTPESVCRKVAKNLFLHGKTRINLLILSHADADHYNGVARLIETIPVDHVVVSPVMFSKENASVVRLREELERRRIPIVIAKAGNSLAELGFGNLRVFHPDIATTGKSSNAASLVVGAEHLGRRVLFPGDLDAAGAPFLKMSPIHFDLILAPHHGGKSESYEELLDWATPRVIVISGGLFQRFPESEADLRRRGFVVLNTFDRGAVRIQIRKPRRGTDSQTDPQAGPTGEMAILP